jgi:hypothetical protein
MTASPASRECVGRALVYLHDDHGFLPSLCMKVKDWAEVCINDYKRGSDASTSSEDLRLNPGMPQILLFDIC